MTRMLTVALPQPFYYWWRCVIIHLFQQVFGGVAEQERVVQRLIQEALLNHIEAERFEGFIETVHIEQADRFGVQPQLAPCKHLEEFFHSAPATGQCYDTLAQFVHKQFALVHGLYYYKLRQAFVCYFLGFEEGWDNTRHLAAMQQCAIGNGTHYAYFGTSVNDLYRIAGQQRPQFIGSFPVDLIIPL